MVWGSPRSQSIWLFTRQVKVSMWQSLTRIDRGASRLGPQFGMKKESPPRIPCVQVFGKVHRELEDLKQRYGFLIVDAGGRDSAELRTAMGIADILLIPLQPSQADVWATEDVVQVLEQARSFNPDIHAMAVLNRCPTHPLVRETKESRSYLEAGRDRTC